MTTIFTNLTLWTGTQEEAVKNAWLAVADGKIINHGTGQAPAKAEDELVDLGGRFVMPGLINAHVHLMMDPTSPKLTMLSETEVTVRAIQNLRTLLAAGVTTVRDCGCAFDVDIKLRDLQGQLGEVVPDIVASGQAMSMTGGHGDFPQGDGSANMSYLVDSDDEMRKAVRTAFKHGADNIKVMATGGVMSPNDRIDDTALSVTEMAVAVAEAHHQHRTVAAHAQGNAGIHNALAAGVDSIEHGIYVDDEQAAFMAANNVALVPTLNAAASISKYGRATLPAHMISKNDQVQADFFAHITRVFQTPVHVVVGTDAGTPFNSFKTGTAEEMALWVESCHATPVQALLGATRYAAELLRIADQRGTLAPGLAADFLVLTANPLDDIHALAATDMQVFKNGVQVH